ncbi:MAG: general stress protein [Nitrospiraceae bacterium]
MVATNQSRGVSPGASPGEGETADRGIVGGLFPDLASAKNAVRALKAARFTEEQIGLAMRNRTDEGELIGETGTKAGEEAVKGALGGGLLGGLAGFLVAAGVLAVPGIGPVLAGGVLASAFGLTGGAIATGAGIGAAAGGLIGGLVGLDVPETEARHFETGIRSGRVLVIVRTKGRAREALGLLERYDGDTGQKPRSPTPPPETTLL